MTKDIDCQVFEDQLDALTRGELPEEGNAQLRLHAAACPECAMQIRVQEHLDLSSLVELEREVPDGLVAGMWTGVKDELATRPAGSLRAGVPRTFSWLVPAMAAATVALLFSTGYLFSELRRIQGTEATLAQQLLEQQRWLAELGSGVTEDPVVRTAALAGRNPLTRALARQDNITITGLQVLLRSLPPGQTLLDASQVEALISNTPVLTPSIWKDALNRMEGRDGIRVRDLLETLEAMDLSPTLTVPTSNLIDLLS